MIFPFEVSLNTGGSGDFQEDGDCHVVEHLRAQDEEHRREAGGPKRAQTRNLC